MAHQATGSNRKHNEGSDTVRKLEEVSGSSRKPHDALRRHSIRLKINKQTLYSGCDSHNKHYSKISTV